MQSETAPTANRAGRRQPKRPDSKAGTVRRILTDGPATTADVIAETGWNRQNACTHLIHLFKRGELTREPFKRKGMPGCFLYSLKAAAP